MKKFFELIRSCLFMVPSLLIMIALVVFMLCGCAGSKHLETERAADYTGHSSSFEDTVDSLRMELSRVVRQTMERFSDLKVEKRTVVWSEPDSCGRQHKERESRTSIDRRDREMSELEEKAMADYLRLSHRIDSLMERWMDSRWKRRRNASFRGGRRQNCTMGALRWFCFWRWCPCCLDALFIR